MRTTGRDTERGYSYLYQWFGTSVTDELVGVTATFLVYPSPPQRGSAALMGPEGPERETESEIASPETSQVRRWLEVNGAEVRWSLDASRVDGATLEGSLSEILSRQVWRAT